MATSEKRVDELHQYIDVLVQEFMVLECNCLKNIGDLSFQELKVINFLGKRGPDIMRKIAGHLMLAVSTMTGIVDKLVQKGLAVRERSDDDRRIVKVSLTEKGQEVYRMDVETHLGLSRGMLQALTRDEQEMLLVLLRKVIRSRQDESSSRAGPGI